MTVEKGFRGLRWIGLDEAGVRLRQVETCSFMRTPPITPTLSPKSTCA